LGIETSHLPPEIGGDAIYPIAMNALMENAMVFHGWVIKLDHGWTKHSKVNLEWIPELSSFRDAVLSHSILWMEF